MAYNLFIRQLICASLNMIRWSMTYDKLNWNKRLLSSSSSSSLLYKNCSVHYHNLCVFTGIALHYFTFILGQGQIDSGRTIRSQKFMVLLLIMVNVWLFKATWASVLRCSIDNELSHKWLVVWWRRSTWKPLAGSFELCDNYQSAIRNLSNKTIFFETANSIKRRMIKKYFKLLCEMWTWVIREFPRS